MLNRLKIVLDWIGFIVLFFIFLAIPESLISGRFDELLGYDYGYWRVMIVCYGLWCVLQFVIYGYIQILPWKKKITS